MAAPVPAVPASAGTVAPPTAVASRRVSAPDVSAVLLIGPAAPLA